MHIKSLEPKFSDLFLKILFCLHPSKITNSITKTALIAGLNTEKNLSSHHRYSEAINPLAEQL